jgi:hypothetical protein
MIYAEKKFYASLNEIQLIVFSFASKTGTNPTVPYLLANPAMP